jgi:hypothetical protein
MSARGSRTSRVFDIAIAIGAAHVGGDRVDDDQDNRSDLPRHFLEKVNIGLERKRLAAGTINFGRRVHNMDALPICCRSH